MRRDIEAGRSDPWILAMAENIRNRLQKLLTPGNSMHKLIGDSLDLEVISQQVQMGGFSYEQFFGFMASILPKLCAPFRDEEVKVLADHTLRSGDVVDRLEALMRFIDEMQLDYSNFILQQSAPDLIKHAVTYEQKRFSDDLDRGVHGLSQTEKWWTQSRALVLAECARRDPEGINLARTRPTPDKFYSQMLLDVFTDLNSNQAPPETLQLDTKRIAKMKNTIRNLVVASAILLQAKNIMKRDVRSMWKNEAPRVLAVLENAKTAQDAQAGIQAALESSRSMPSATRAHVKALVVRLTDNHFANAVSYSSENGEIVPISEAVSRLLLKRLRDHILARLSAMTASEKVRAQSTASESLATLGMPEFVSQVGRVVEELGRVGVVDREAHGVWYEIVAKKVEIASAATA